jgi:hypothetical protein
MKDELKTLKDIYDFDNSLLRQEAIKEVKILNDHYESCVLFPFKILNDRERKVLQSFIKWKFNIPEDDLK